MVHCFNTRDVCLQDAKVTCHDHGHSHMTRTGMEQLQADITSNISFFHVTMKHEAPG